MTYNCSCVCLTQLFQSMFLPDGNLCAVSLCLLPFILPQSLLQASRFPISKVVPQPRPLPVRHTVFAIVNIFVGQIFHKGLFLQKSGLWVFNHPRKRFELIHYLNGSRNYPVRLFYLPHSCGFRYAIFSARRGCPNKIKVSRRILIIVPVQYITIDVGVLQIQRNNLPVKSLGYFPD